MQTITGAWTVASDGCVAVPEPDRDGSVHSDLGGPAGGAGAPGGDSCGAPAPGETVGDVCSADGIGGIGGGDGGGGDGGCFLTAAVVELRGEADGGPTLSALRAFRDGYMARTAEAAAAIKMIVALSDSCRGRSELTEEGEAELRGLAPEMIPKFVGNVYMEEVPAGRRTQLGAGGVACVVQFESPPSRLISFLSRSPAAIRRFWPGRRRTTVSSRSPSHEPSSKPGATTGRRPLPLTGSGTHRNPLTAATQSSRRFRQQQRRMPVTRPMPRHRRLMRAAKPTARSCGSHPSASGRVTPASQTALHARTPG